MQNWRILKSSGTLHVFLAPLALLLLLESHSHELRDQQAAHTFPTMRAALDALSSKYKVQIGLEYAAGDLDRTPVTLTLSSSSVAPQFDDLITEKPTYFWTLNGSVYNICPKSATDGLLDLNIRSFAVNDATPQQMSTAIDELPEVKEWLRNHHVRRNELETGPRWKDSDQRASLTVSGAPLRQLLNRIIEVTGRSTWVVVRYGDQGEFIAIYI